MKKYKVWECKIVVPEDADLPAGFDSPPRCAAQKAIEDSGIEVLANFSGWGGSITDSQAQVCTKHMSAWINIYPSAVSNTRYNSKEGAILMASSTVLDTIKIEWEE